MGKTWEWPQPREIRIPIAQPWLTDLEIEHCNTALRENWIGSNGPYNHKTEEFLSSFFDQPALTVSNGSVALMLALRALGIGPDDEVLVPDLTYAASASSVVNVGATPVLCDVELDTWGISLGSMETMLTKKTKAVIVVHLYGVPANIEPILTFARKHNLYVVEDCAESFGATVNGKKCGTFGDVATFSFFANKLISSGEGGAVSTGNQEILQRMKLLRGQGMDPERRYYFLEPGYNFRMTNPQAAILFGQLERLTEIVKQRTEVESHYGSLLSDYSTGQSPRVNTVIAPWIFTTIFSGINSDTRYELAQFLADAGIETRPVFWPLSNMPAFEQFECDSNTNSRVIGSSGISLPTGIHVQYEDREKIAELIVSFMKGVK
jgi:perosamine synthetase